MKHYLVTGASKGIGKAISQHLLEEGCVIYGIAREFDWEHARLKRFSLDLSCLSTLPDSLEALKKKIHTLDGVVGCAGKGRFGSLEEFSYAQIREVIDLNFLSHAYLIKAFLPILKRQRRGDIVLIGSEASLAGKRQGSIYCASKFALRGFCQALREECTASHVRVTLINPGMVQTDFFQDLHFECGAEPFEHLLPNDIAELVSHLLKMRHGAVCDEINLSAQKKCISFKTRV